MSYQSPSAYDILLRKLYLTPLFRHEKDDELVHMKTLIRRLGLAPHILERDCNNDCNPLIFHVAGSNGKGSVCYKLAYILAYSGKYKRVGLFTSPHISCFRERICILDSSDPSVEQKMITEHDVVHILEKIFQVCEANDIAITFFEVVTALGFYYFSIIAKCDAVVLEVGLGGRLDATNVITSPTASVITSIGLEHTHILGNTLEAIAREKAGIIKAGTDLIVGPCVPHNVIIEEAQKKGVKCYKCDDLLTASEYEKDDFDIQNSRISTAVVELLSRKNLFSVTTCDTA